MFHNPRCSHCDFASDIGDVRIGVAKVESGSNQGGVSEESDLAVDRGI